MVETITIFMKDLENIKQIEYERGYNEGFNDAKQETIDRLFKDIEKLLHGDKNDTNIEKSE